MEGRKEGRTDGWTDGEGRIVQLGGQSYQLVLGPSSKYWAKCLWYHPAEWLTAIFPPWHDEEMSHSPFSDRRSLWPRFPNNREMVEMFHLKKPLRNMEAGLCPPLRLSIKPVISQRKTLRSEMEFAQMLGTNRARTKPRPRLPGPAMTELPMASWAPAWQSWIRSLENVQTTWATSNVQAVYLYLLATASKPRSILALGKPLPNSTASCSSDSLAIKCTVPTVSTGHKLSGTQQLKQKGREWGSHMYFLHWILMVRIWLYGFIWLYIIWNSRLSSILKATAWHTPGTQGFSDSIVSYLLLH